MSKIDFMDFVIWVANALMGAAFVGGVTHWVVGILWFAFVMAYPLLVESDS